MSSISGISRATYPSNTAVVTPGAEAQLKETSDRWGFGQFFTAAVGVLATLQGLPTAAARTAPPPPRSLLPPPPPPHLAPAPAPAPAPVLANDSGIHLVWGLGIPAPPPPSSTPVASTSTPSGTASYDQCGYRMTSGNYACLLGLPMAQVQGLEPTLSGITCNDFINILWSNENAQALQTGGPTSNYTQAILFEIPDDSECCAVYQTTDSRGCIDPYPDDSACTLKDRNCVSFGYPFMKQIVAGESPQAIGGAGICEKAGSDQIHCITETNVFIPAQESTGGSSGGTTVQVTNGCSVNSATGELTGTCTVNPTDTLG